MADEPFGFDREDLERAFRAAGEQLQGAFGQFGKLIDSGGAKTAWSGLFDDVGRRARPAPERETTGDTGDGVWAIYTVDAAGGAQVDQVFATELDALRANRHNTDSSRKVRFLPYGMAITVLDEPAGPESAAE